MIATTLLLVSLALPGYQPSGIGSIRGTVLNKSAAAPVPCQATVVLRILADNGQFVPFRETVSDLRGTFQFDHLPVGSAIRYMAGANRHDIHYPGPRIRLTAAQPDAVVELSVHDAVPGPNPLVIGRYEIEISPEPGALRVTESMLVENPSSTCYVGEPAEKGADPITMQLSIPMDFERATFREEFFGRRFAVVNNQVVTNIPWPPGQRELKFTYVLRNLQTVCRWERPLDLPCRQIEVRVRGPQASEVHCDLPWLPVDRAGEQVYGSSEGILPAGHVIHVTLGHLPLPWMVYARWTALATLVVLLGGVTYRVARRGTRPAAARDRGPSGSGRKLASEPLGRETATAKGPGAHAAPD